MDLLVMAKEPVPGRVKTRLCPPCTPRQAAALAEAALIDTLAAARTAAGVDRVVLALDGEPGSWLPDDVVVVEQGDGPLDRRLTRAWSHVEGPALQIGMDTPQVTPELLTDAIARLARPGVDAVLGDAEDGGWWAIGLRRSGARVFFGIPTSRPDTGARQRRRLESLGLRTAPLPVLRDVDTFADALSVGRQAPSTAFGATLATMLEPMT